MTSDSKTTEDELKTYYQQAASWDEDRQAAAQKTLRLYHLMTVGLLGVLMLALVCITSLVTREKVQPFLALVDKRTGEVTTPTRLTTNALNVNWNMVRHFVSNYLTARESYNFLNVNSPYQDVLSMSSDEVKTQYEQVIRPELNEQSPIKTLAQHHYLSTTIHSIAKLSSDNLLDIRFTTHRINSTTNQDEEQKDWRVTLRWEFNLAARSLQEWDKNPLGFTVLFYDKQPVAHED